MTEHNYVVIGYNGADAATLFDGCKSICTAKCGNVDFLKAFAKVMAPVKPLTVAGDIDNGFDGEAFIGKEQFTFSIRPGWNDHCLFVSHGGRDYAYKFDYRVEVIYKLASWINGWEKAPFLKPPLKLGDTKLSSGWQEKTALYPATERQIARFDLSKLTLFDVAKANISVADKIRIIAQPANIGFKQFAKIMRAHHEEIAKSLDPSYTVGSWWNAIAAIEDRTMLKLRQLLNEPKDPQ